MHDKENIRVREIGQLDGRTLGVTWTDGRKDAFDVVELRRMCPCAGCVDEMSGKRTLRPADVPDSVRPVRIQSLGSYAMQIFFSDGHSTGYYSFPYLRDIAGGKVSSGPSSAP